MRPSLREPVFVISFAFVLGLVLIGAAIPERFGAVTGWMLAWVTVHFGWFYLLSVFGFVVILVYLAFSKYGGIRLGEPDSEPEFSFFSWVAMLLAAGFGVGLVFYGVAEPMSHYLEPPHGMLEGGTAESARLAIQYSFFDWGVHQWAAFSLVGLIIGFFVFRKGKPGLISTFLDQGRPRTLRFRRCMGALDVFAVVATVMGVATSLGLGVLQINGGLHHLFGAAENVFWQGGILALVFGAYMISSASGLHRGIKVLSTINLSIATFLMVYVIVVGPTLTILDIIVQGMGDYLQNFFAMSLRTAPFSGSTWAGEWTIFYWAWVISWSPFVGTFVARISYGRTIRQYIFGVLVMPPLIACLWMGVFGGAALHMEMYESAGIAAATKENITTAFFRLFEHLPLSEFLSLIGLTLILIFLITSADSASFIVAQMSDRGRIQPSLFKRIIWGGLIAATCLTLIATGGLGGLQAAVVVAALPFTLILYAMVWILFRELAADRRESLEELYRQHDETPVGATIEEAHRLND